MMSKNATAMTTYAKMMMIQDAIGTNSLSTIVNDGYWVSLLCHCTIAEIVPTADDLAAAAQVMKIKRVVDEYGATVDGGRRVGAEGILSPVRQSADTSASPEVVARSCRFCNPLENRRLVR